MLLLRRDDCINSISTRELAKAKNIVRQPSSMSNRLTPLGWIRR